MSTHRYNLDPHTPLIEFVQMLSGVLTESATVKTPSYLQISLVRERDGHWLQRDCKDVVRTVSVKLRTEHGSIERRYTAKNDFITSPQVACINIAHIAECLYNRRDCSRWEEDQIARDFAILRGRIDYLEKVKDSYRREAMLRRQHDNAYGHDIEGS